MKLKKALQRTNLKKRILSAVIVFSMSVSYFPVYASAIKDAEKTKNEAQENLDKMNQTINNIQSRQNDLQAEMAAYDGELTSLLTDMELLKGEIASKEIEIQEANAALDVAQLEERSQYDAMKLRIQYMYENGNQSIWTALVGAESISDLLNRAEYVSEVYEYDRQLLTAYQDTVQQVTDLTEQLGCEMEEMAEIQISYQQQEKSLEQVISEKRTQMADFDNQLANAQSLAGEYAKTVQQQNQIIADEKAKQARLAAQKAAEAKKNQSASSGSAAGGKTDQNTAAGGSDSGSSSNSNSNGLTDSGLNPSHMTGVSGSSVVSYAETFLGAPYVLGGNSLTNGTDCSYFVMAVFQNYGISLPRNSYAMQKSGQAVSYENAQAGDIICYPGHVAIYMGNGRIIHASTPSTGVCYGNATYRTITTVRRVL